MEPLKSEYVMEAVNFIGYHGLNHRQFAFSRKLVMYELVGLTSAVQNSDDSGGIMLNLFLT